MSTRVKIFLIGGGILAALLIVLITLGLILPRIIDLAPIRQRILADVSRTLGAEAEFDKVSLSILPRPEVRVDGTEFFMPERLSGRIASLTIRPKILPLLAARFRPSKCFLEGPSLTVNLPKRQKSDKEKQKENPAAVIDKVVEAFLSTTSTKTPGLSVEVAEGILKIHQANKPIVILENVEGCVRLPAGGMKIDLRCTSRLWEILTLEGHLDSKNLGGHGVSSTRGALLPVSMGLEAAGVDVFSTRKAALAVAGKERVIKGIFDVLKGGRVPLIRIHARGNQVSDLTKLENMRIEGSLEMGKISVSQVGIDFRQVHGKVVIAQGILEGSKIEAQWDKERLNGGALKLGLRGKDAPFHLEAVIDTDLAKLPPLLKRLVKNETFQKELSRIHDLRGNARGRLILGESMRAIQVTVEVTELNLFAHHAAVPYDIEIKEGHFTYRQKKEIGLDALGGRLGASFIRGFSAALTLEKEPYLEITSGELEVSLEEIYPWLVSFEALGTPLKDVGHVAGSLILSQLRGRGPLYRPGAWHFNTTGEIRGARVETSLLPGAVKVQRSGFHAVNNDTKKELTLTRARVNLLDASLEVSGVLTDCLQGLHRADVRLQGKAGSRSIEWLWRLLRLSPWLKPQSPLSVASGRLTYSQHSTASFQGDVVVQGGPKVTVDIVKENEKLHLRNMHIQDKDTSATLTLDTTGEILNLEFTGRLTRATMHRLFEKEDAAGGWVEGDLRLRLDREEPTKSQTWGKLTGGNLLLPFGSKAPVTIETVSVEGKERTLQINSAAFLWDGNRAAAEGEISFAPGGIHLDVHFSAKDLAWETIADTLGRKKAAARVTGRRDFWTLPLRGKLSLAVERFAYDSLVWTPFHGQIDFTQDAVDVALSDANLCGIKTPGSLRVTPHDITLNVRAAAAEQDLDTAFTCFFEEKKQMTGRFSLTGEISGQEEPTSLLQSMQGNLEFMAKDGRIYRYGLLAKVLAFVNVTEVFRGKTVDLAEKGLPYDVTEAKVHVEDGKLVLTEGLIMGPSVEMACTGTVHLMEKSYDLTFLVAPLKTVDSLAKRIPLLGRILGGTIVSIPVQVSGPWSNPTITPLPASAVGSRLLGIMKRTLELPVEVMESLPSGETKSKME
jgi:hypothetical protein